MTNRHNHTPVADVCTGWWRELNGLDIETGAESKPPNRAAIAKLRRIGTVTVDGREEMDTATELGYYAALYNQLKPFRHDRDQENFGQAVAVVAGTLARVREEASGKTAALLGVTRDDKRLMQEERFKRLIRTRDWADLHSRGRRIVHLLGRAVPVGDMGASLFLWFSGPHVIRDWSLAYYDLSDTFDSNEPVATALAATATP